MDSFHFDSYISSPYSGSSAPRTPSPQTSSDGAPSPAHFKTELEPICSIFSDQMLDDHAVPPEGHSLWQGGLSHQSLPFNGSRGSLLGELYDHDHSADRPANIYDQPNDTGEWQSQLSRQVPNHHSQEAAAMRRATYPYVRQDRDVPAHYSPAPFIPQDCEQSRAHYHHSDSTLYGEPLPLVDNSPQLISFGQDNHSYHPGHYDMSVSSSPASSYVEFENLDHNVKLEESAPVIVPSQTCLYRPPSSGGMHGMSYLPHAGLPVQHTDDAASKETQYLRRRCFNCSQTEPPSWRRSTLNPGKIVCNKCGLYERTHLRPRPLRFDELRTGNKSRKQSKSISGTSASKLIKKEVESQAISRRASVSSSSSSVHSSSDWDDSGTIPLVLLLICGIDFSPYSVCLFLWFSAYLILQLSRCDQFFPSP
jgi:GATA-binding protein, other eukaryote